MMETYTETELTEAAGRVARRNALEMILREVHDRRKFNPLPRVDDGTFTWGELEQYYTRIFGGGQTRANAVKKFILENLREPEYLAGTVVKDAEGNFFRRLGDDGWSRFGTSQSVPFEKPVRPLTVI